MNNLILKSRVTLIVILLQSLASLGQSGTSKASLATRPDTITRLVLKDIERIPSNIGRFTNLVSLKIKGKRDSNDTLYFIEELVNCKSLRSLEISYYSVPLLPVLENLDTLIYECGRNCSPPPLGLSNLKNLKWLELDVIDIPHEISKLGELEFLGLYGTFRDIPPKIFDLPKLKTLLLWGLYDHIPMEISHLDSVRFVYLLSNNLLEIQPTLFDIQSLNELIIKGGEVEAFPSGINPHCRLKYLAIRETSLRDLGDIDRLIMLQELYLQDNSLTNIPESAKFSPSLKILNLSNNQIDSLPASIAHTDSLEMLLLAKNNLNYLPQEILDLKMLRAIDISSNNFDEIPSIFWNLGEGIELGLYGNKIDNEEIRKFFSVKAELVSRGNQFFLHFYNR